MYLQMREPAPVRAGTRPERASNEAPPRDHVAVISEAATPQAIQVTRFTSAGKSVRLILMLQIALPTPDQSRRTSEPDLRS